MGWESFPVFDGSDKMKALEKKMKDKKGVWVFSKKLNSWFFLTFDKPFSTKGDLEKDTFKALLRKLGHDIRIKEDK